ncbi:MAG: cysteine desulfurase [Phycisphaerales bacterium]|nr:cysteine desulfurase [Phycisphaerales bacterium]
MNTIYLDNNATTCPAPEVIAAVHEAMTECWGNPSSIHRVGQTVRRKMDLARQSVGQLLGCKDRDIIFTSGGTEAANLAIFGSLRAFSEGAQHGHGGGSGGTKRRVLVTSQVEHSSIRESAKRLSNEGYEVVYLPNDEDGVVDVAALAELLNFRAAEIALVAVMWSNNETGVIQPVQKLGSLCAEHGVRFYTDGTQWVGKMPTNVSQMPIDLMSFAAHKFHGPKGAGGLYVKPKTRLVPMTIGGPQERERRGGTENVSGFLGMGVAAQLAWKWLQTDERLRLAGTRDRFEKQMLEAVDCATINGSGAQRQWNTSNIAFCGLDTEAILLSLSERGVCASGGSACASGSIDPSPILKAMGIPPERAHGSVRFSLSRYTTQEELDKAVEIVPGVVNRLRKMTGAMA